MARNDYAKKSRGKASASRAPRKKSAPAKRPFPLIRVVLSLLFLAGFGYALVQLTSVSPDPQAEQQATSQPTSKAPTSKQSTTSSSAKSVKQAAPKPTQTTAKSVPKTTTAKTTSGSSATPIEDKSERFEFYRMLKESEVDTANVEPYKSTPKDAKSKYTYVLQTGSFQSLKDAEQMRARLILEGLPNVHTRRVTNSNGSIWHQVRVGPFDNRSLLNKAQDRLARMNIQPLLRRID